MITIFDFHVLNSTNIPIKEMQECYFENFYFVFYVQQIVAGQCIILSSKGLNHNLKISPPAPEIFLLHWSTWFLYLKKKPDSWALKAIQRQ